MAFVQDDVVPLKVVLVEGINVGADHAVCCQTDAALVLHALEVFVALRLAGSVKCLLTGWGRENEENEAKTP
jgi:hypothetical protein